MHSLKFLGQWLRQNWCPAELLANGLSAIHCPAIGRNALCKVSEAATMSASRFGHKVEDRRPPAATAETR
jgi:hypothetical protein